MRKLGLGVERLKRFACICTGGSPPAYPQLVRTWHLCIPEAWLSIHECIYGRSSEEDEETCRNDSDVLIVSS